MSEPITAGRRVTPDAVLVVPANASREDWLEARRKRAGVGYCIGASDAPSILDVAEVGTPREVYAQKVLGYSKPTHEAMRWGTLLEPDIAQEWQHRRQCVVKRVGLVANVDHPWLQCTLDRRVAECPDNRDLRSRCALEVKTRGAFRRGRLHATVPDDLLAQCMVQMIVTGYRHVHTAVLVGGNELHDPVVWWDQEVADYILGELISFRERYLVPEVEPEWSPDKAAKEIELDKALHPDRVGAIGIEDVGEVIEYGRLAAAAGQAARARIAAQARLLQIADGKRELRFADEPAVWWREGTDTTVDLETLARFPEAYEASVSTKTTWTIQIAKAYKPNETRVS